MVRRDRAQIFAEILAAIIEESRGTGKAKLTRVQTKVYVPYDRFKAYLIVMRDKGLIEVGSLKITEKGIKYLEQYNLIIKSLERFGLE